MKLRYVPYTEQQLRYYTSKECSTDMEDFRSLIKMYEMLGTPYYIYDMIGLNEQVEESTCIYYLNKTYWILSQNHPICQVYPPLYQRFLLRMHLNYHNPIYMLYKKLVAPENILSYTMLDHGIIFKCTKGDAILYRKSRSIPLSCLQYFTDNINA